MPNTASAKKRLRQSAERRDRNRAVKSLLRKRIRDVRQAIQAGDTERAVQASRDVAKQLDRAAARNVIHANRAGRLKSRMQRAIRKIKQSSGAA